MRAIVAVVKGRVDDLTHSSGVEKETVVGGRVIRGEGVGEESEGILVGV